MGFSLCGWIDGTGRLESEAGRRQRLMARPGNFRIVTVVSLQSHKNNCNGRSSALFCAAALQKRESGPAIARGTTALVSTDGGGLF
jgi:hypothetical protein